VADGVTAYCAPGRKAAAAGVLALSGERVDEVVEHPWLGADDGIILVNGPTRELTAVPFAVSEQRCPVLLELAAADPDRFHPDLAQSLNNLATTLSALGRPFESDQIAREASRNRCGSAMASRFC
jgi:hypothetical protein